MALKTNSQEPEFNENDITVIVIWGVKPERSFQEDSSKQFKRIRRIKDGGR